MPNQYVNKVIYEGQTLIDLQSDSVEPNKVLQGETFHDRSGTPQTGSMITYDVYDDLDSTSSNDALSANQGRVLKNNIDTINSNLGLGENIISSISPATGTTIQQARKYGNRIRIVGVTPKITAANSYQNIATVAQGYRPAVSTIGIVASGATSDFGYGQLTITTNGSIDVIYSKTTSYGLYFSVEYIA